MRREYFYYIDHWASIKEGAINSMATIFLLCNRIVNEQKTA